MNKIDNSKLLPLYKKDYEITLDDGLSPDWVKDLIIVELRLATATSEGTIKAAYRLLDHYSEMGVNGIWLTPVYDVGETGNGYGSIGPHTIDPALTGTNDYEEGFNVLKEFICAAHKKNIRIFLDVVTWGTVLESPLIKEHPDFYSGDEVWGGQRFQFVDTPWQKWFFDRMMFLIMEVGADGFRCDCEPNYTGYALFKAVREHCLEMGRKIMIFSEDQNERLGTYDFEQYGVMQTLYEWGVDKNVVNPRNHYLEAYNIVDSVKSGDGVGSRFSQIHGKGGTYRFYSFNTSCHDNGKTSVDGNILAIGYQALLAPFIPVMWCGDELGDISHNGSNCLYFQPPRFELLGKTENREFFELVKKIVSVRRSYPSIFTYFPPNHRESNICKINSNSNLQAYARYYADKAVLVIPNNSDESLTVTAEVPFAHMGMDSKALYRYFDLLEGKPVAADGHGNITVQVNAFNMAVILMEKD